MNNIYTKASIYNPKEHKPFNLNDFNEKEIEINNENDNINNVKTSNIEKKLEEINNLLNNLNENNNSILDKQIIESISNLERKTRYFNKKLVEIEDNILKISTIIAKKIIDLEISEKSHLIAKKNLDNIFNNIKNSQNIKIYLNPIDYDYLTKKS